MEKGFEINSVKVFIKNEWIIILFFMMVKLIIHLLTFSNFELHRDAYLYYAQSQHLAWGYFSVPPTTAFLGRVATELFGNTTFALRFFPAIIGSLHILIIGTAVRELGGKWIAISLASIAFILSPAFLHVNSLFQPVSLDIFYWLLTGYLVLLMVRRNNPKIWLWIAVVCGLAFLNKYSIVFYLLAIIIALLISEYRRLLVSRYLLYSVPVGLIIIFPNIQWQIRHSWPVIEHMAELRDSQLVHVEITGFLLEQLIMNIQALLLWIGAFLILLFYKGEKKYRVFSLVYLFVLAILLILSGKSYYTLGAYPILFVFGAYFVEKYIARFLVPIAGLLMISMLVSLYISLDFDGIPFRSFENTIRKDAFRWEDGDYHDLPQDMADMTGWKEIGEKVARVYIGLDDSLRADCDIYCYHYGQAGAVMFYGKNAGVPQPISFNGSFAYWSPDSLTKRYVIWVHTDLENDFDIDTVLTEYFDKYELKEVVRNKYFREDGTGIYLCEEPTENLKNRYIQRIAETRRYSRVR